MNKELKILKWVAIALACLSTVFTLVIVGSHLMGRLVGLGKVGVIGSVGAELMAIVCAWLSASEKKIVAGVAMLCAIVLTAVLLVNASIALDLDWQETQIEKTESRKLENKKAESEEERKTLALKAQLAGQLGVIDKRMAREFIKSDTKPSGPVNSLPPESETGPQSVDVAKLDFYSRFGLTTVPLFLALLTVIALGLAAHSSSGYSPIKNVSDVEWPEHLEVGRVSESKNKARFEAKSRSYTPSDKPLEGVATRDGLAIIRQVLHDFAFNHPGNWYKADKRAKHILVRLCRREEGREVVIASAKLSLAFLDQATLEPNFRKTVKAELKKQACFF